jgi:FtsP/CotA-like multicopper oxidase with cupredoxin domain
MQRKITRRDVLYFGAGLLAGQAARSLVPDDQPLAPVPRRFQRALPIPPILKPVRTEADTDYYEITQRESEVEILPGLRTRIWGYEGMLPGPTIQARQGRSVVVRHTNRLSVPTAVHLHGGLTPPESDGFPTDVILPGHTRTYVYPSSRRAATLWYHDHAMGHTGRNIFMGLSGLYLVHDDEELSLRLPEGAYDVPLLIQDRMFAADGSLTYKPLNHLGAGSTTLLVNGAPWPFMEVARRKYRFRIVNGCNSVPLRLALSSGNPLVQIATEGGLLPAPISCQTIPLAMAERVEVIIDFSIYPAETIVVLQNLNTSREVGTTSSEIMQFRITREQDDDGVIPERLCDFSPILAAEAKRTRNFVLSARPSFGFVPIVNWKINGKAFDPDQPIASPVCDDVEIWRFTNRRFIGLLSLVHPMHIHLVNFLVLERNGQPPLPHERGWKDTVAVDKDEEVAVLAKFDRYCGRYLVHCHNLEHEDHSMMARFDVVER